MRFELNIDYPPEKMELTGGGAAWQKFRYVDRVPVSIASCRATSRRCSTCATGFFQDAETHYYWQLQFAKYRSKTSPRTSAPARRLGLPLF